MKFLWRYLQTYRGRIAGVMGIKLSATVVELLIPYVMEHLIDRVVPTRELGRAIFWGAVMILLALCVRALNVTANRLSVRTAKECAYAIRRDLFHAALYLSGSQIDAVGLPSLISRMISTSLWLTRILVVTGASPGLVTVTSRMVPSGSPDPITEPRKAATLGWFSANRFLSPASFMRLIGFSPIWSILSFQKRAPTGAY